MSTNVLAGALSRIAELERQLAEREADARRYRWLRHQHWNSSNIFVVNDDRKQVRLGTNCPSGALLDAAIDGAIKAQEGKS